jgi:hypothetical protein
MATEYKVLGQVESTGTITSYDTLYTCPSATSAIVSTVSICNRGSSDADFRLSISDTTTPDNSEFIAYDSTVAGNDTSFITVGLVIDATINNIMCSSNSASVSFSAFGSEIS